MLWTRLWSQDLRSAERNVSGNGTRPKRLRFASLERGGVCKARDL